MSIIVRRLTVLVCAVIAAASCFALGALHMRRLDAEKTATYDARLEALRDELQQAMARESGRPEGTSGRLDSSWGPLNEASGATAPENHAGGTVADPARAALIADIKTQLGQEMGWLPVSLLRERRASFVELHTYDADGSKNYGTAGYLGDGYFITVKHAVVALPASGARSIASIKVVYGGKEVPAKLVDAGSARVEVDPGDWAIIRTRNLDLPPLRVDAQFPYEFAEPIFRLGNDYSKGIVASTGYVGQRMDNGLITCLTDGHPGASGGGVLDARGTLVGIPIGRMQGDYRFSFILPIRAEMLRKVPALAQAVGKADLQSSLPPHPPRSAY